MAIDTQNKRRSVSGYSGHLVAPIADGTIGVADRAHAAWLYAGTSAGAPTVDEGYISDATYYDDSAPTGSLAGGTVQEAEYSYD